MDEKRRSPRRRVLKSGSIVFNGGRSVMSCTLRNVSDHGALLKLDNTLSIPSQFVLCFDRASVHCEIIRRALGELGVEFLSSLDHGRTTGLGDTHSVMTA
jgi:hypothetical protein